jgi:hypothetical protein
MIKCYGCNLRVSTVYTPTIAIRHMLCRCCVIKTAADYARHLARLRDVKPRSLAKLYGSNGPTGDQENAHEDQMRNWSRRYRLVSKLYKAALAAQSGGRS